jgi:hypothetical protein
MNMKRVTAALAMIALLAGAMAAGTASAHGRVSVGVGFGFGWPGYWGGPGYWGWPGYWGAPYPYYAPYYYPPVVVQEQPVTYIERGDAAPARESRESRRDWWYYCPETKTYYPYVKECANGWQKVAPQPPSER